MKKLSTPATLIAAETRKGKTVGAVMMASRVMRYLQASKAPVTVTQIVRELGLNASTCFNILRTLVDEDFVDIDPANKTYTLSLGVVSLARGALEQNVELKLLQPKLQEFAIRHNVLVACSRRISRERSMLVAIAETDAPIRLHARVGATAPLFLGATGRVFAAFSEFTDADLEASFHKLRLARGLDFETFRAQVEEVRHTGWAIDDGYYFPGMVTVAAPILEVDRRVTLCCGAMMFNGQHDLKRIAQIANELVEICSAVGTSHSKPPAEEAPAAKAPPPRAVVRIAKRPKATTAKPIERSKARAR